MRDISRQSTMAERFPKTVRPNRIRLQTSANAGVVIPLAYIPLLREDGIKKANMRFKFDMQETAETLVNGIRVSVQAWFMPQLAMDRFDGLDVFNKSYAGLPPYDGEPVVPFFNMAAYGSHAPETINPIFQALGMQGKTTDLVNWDIVEAYNQIQNHRYRDASSDIELRELDDTSLAPAFWHHSQFDHVVPTFDQAMIDGEVNLTIEESKLLVQGVGTRPATSFSTNTINKPDGTSSAELNDDLYGIKDLNGDFADVYVEMQQSGLKMNMSNFHLAKKTAAYARIMRKHEKLPEAYLRNMVMNGMRIPETEMMQPHLINEATALFGYRRQNATDGDSLGDGVTTGDTVVDIPVRLAPTNTGGMIMYTAEIVPEQLFERKQDYYFHNGSVENLPERMRDDLDQQPVSVVPNSYVDIDHTDPTGTFGYAPLNYQWSRDMVNIGGKFHKPNVADAFDEDRQILWMVEQVDPTLTSDFLLCNSFNQSVFASTNTDSFEIQGRAEVEIVGNTTFGPTLYEGSNAYDAIVAEIPTEQIDQDE